MMNVRLAAYWSPEAEDLTDREALARFSTTLDALVQGLDPGDSLTVNVWAVPG